MLFIIAPLVTSLIARAQAQAGAVDCDATAPCQSLTSLLALQNAPMNDTLFAEADLACGGDALGVMAPLVFACANELEVPEGCECTTTSCAPAINSLEPECLDVLVSTLCSEAYWLDSELKVNLRGIFQHLGNDCAGLSLSCPASVPAFDPEVCAAGAGNATAVSSATAETTAASSTPADSAGGTESTARSGSGTTSTTESDASAEATTAGADSEVTETSSAMQSFASAVAALAVAAGAVL